MNFQPSSCFSLLTAGNTGLSHHTRLSSLSSDITQCSPGPFHKGGKGFSSQCIVNLCKTKCPNFCFPQASLSVKSRILKLAQPCPFWSPRAKTQQALPPGHPAPAPACLGIQMPCPELAFPRRFPAFPTGNLTSQGRAGGGVRGQHCWKAALLGFSCSEPSLALPWSLTSHSAGVRD